MSLTRGEQFKLVQKEGYELFLKKNNDYGDAFAEYGPIGVLIRMNDKINRCKQINETGITLVEDERMRDTLIDLHNYSAMAIMLLDENKIENETLEDKKSKIEEQIYSLEEKIIDKKLEYDSISKQIYNKCNHQWIPDRDQYEPCGPTPKICRICGQQPRY